MNFLKNKISDESIDLINSYNFLKAVEISEYKWGLSDDLRGVPKKTRKWVADKVNEQSPKEYKQFSYEQNVISKAINILSLLGYDETAEQLAKILRNFEISVATKNLYLDCLISGASKFQRSQAASGSRHRQKEEIMEVIRNTWKEHPWVSKTRMQRAILEEYKVCEKTLKFWLKEAGYGKVAVIKNKKFSLVKTKE